MYIINLDSVDAQTPGVGAKANSLGLLSKSGFAIPKGFVVTSEAFEKFLTDTGIRLLLPQILEGVDQENPRTAFEASRKIRELFSKYSGNDFIIRELRDAYNELSFGKDVNLAGGAALDLIKAGRAENFVSVRPSVICPNGQIGFPGHGKASLNLIGYRQILAAVKDCWLSAFSPEPIVYRKMHGIGQFSLAVIVQKMVDSELSGTMFTSNPLSGNSAEILVEGFWGLGETLCCGCLSPDQYLIQKERGNLISKRPAKKLWLRRRGPLSGMTIQERVPASRIFMETLSEKDFPRFAAMASKLDGIFRSPQEIEWGVERGRIVVTQARPVIFSARRKEGDFSMKLSTGENTSIDNLQPPSPSVQVPPSVEVSAAQSPEKLASGIAVSPGIANGRTVSSAGLSDMQKPSEPSVLITKTLGMEILPYLKWFSGIVSEQGGSGSCMASVGRELGIPMVAGVENAGIILAGKEIVVDGMSGSVYTATR